MFEMEEADVFGTRLRVWKNAPASLRVILEASRGRGDAAFIVYEDEALDLRGALPRGRAPRARSSSSGYGVEKGDRVAIAMRNFPEWSIAFWAAAAAGAIVVPLNAWWTRRRARVRPARLRARRSLFVDGERVERLADVLPRARPRDDRRRRAPRPTCRAASSGGRTCSATCRPTPSCPTSRSSPRTTRRSSTRRARPGSPRARSARTATSAATCSSLAFARARARSCARGKPPAVDAAAQNVYLLSVPFFHATGCHSVLVRERSRAGGKLVLMHKWDAERALELIERERVTTFGGVPAMVWQVLESPTSRRATSSSVQSIGYGGAPAAPELVRRIEELFPGAHAVERLRADRDVVGHDDRTPATTTSASPTASACRCRSCDVRVVDDDGNDAAGRRGRRAVDPRARTS